MPKRVRVVVSGRVQMVGFRWSCREMAAIHGITGSVRNRRDGAVEAVFEGDADAVDAMVAWCRVGPGGAVVTRVETHEEPPAGDVVFVIAG